MTTDTPSSITVRDHPFEPDDPERPWGRCKHCSLYGAAHLHGAAAGLGSGPPFRCPYCVNLGISPCPHGREGALGLDGQPYRETPEPLPEPLPVPEINMAQMEEYVVTPLEDAPQSGGRYQVIAYDWKPPNVVAAFDNRDAAMRHAERLDALALRCFVRDTRPEDS